MSQLAPARGRDNMTLSAVVYVGERACAVSLDETLFSLAIQDWRDAELVVALAPGGAGRERRVAEAVEAQPWPSAPRYKVLSSGASGPAARGALLGRAVTEASGRFLALLDAGREVVYQHGYAALIGRLVESGCGSAAGGCRCACVREASGRGFVVTKYDFTLDGSPLRLWRRSPAPLCAHVIDRSRVADSALVFGKSAGASAEREFLARLYAASAPDVTLRHVFVCERRLRAGGPGGMVYAAARGGYRLKARIRRMKERLRGGASTGEK
jgi:hypothetical protein